MHRRVLLEQPPQEIFRPRVIGVNEQGQLQSHHFPGLRLFVAGEVVFQHLQPAMVFGRAACPERIAQRIQKRIRA